MAQPTPMPPDRRKAFTVVNFSSAPLWLAMILAPRSRLTERLMGAVAPLQVVLGAAYDAFLASGVSQGDVKLDFSDPDAVRAALMQPDFFLAGWTHYIAFDLFVGRWIWEDAIARGRAPRLALFLTWMAGPAGLSLYLVQRRLFG
jgi:hypothetical protein